MNPSPAPSSISMRFAHSGLVSAAILLLVATSVLVNAQDARPADAQTPAPRKQIHIIRPRSGSIDSNRLREPLEPRVMEMQNLPIANNTGSGVTYTCDPNVAASTCEYLNTTVANFYKETFTNANANIYIVYGTTGLGSTETYYNFITYEQYVAALNAITSKSAIQTSALSALNTYDATPYGSDNVEVTVALAEALGFSASDFTGITATGDSCTPGVSGCYNAVTTITNDPGTPLYYDNLGGTEPDDAYDFYSTVIHETDEVLGTSSCISTQNNPLIDGCGAGIPSAVDLFRYSSSGHLVLDSSLSTTAGAYFSYNGGSTNGANGRAGTPKVYNTLDNGDDYADFVSSAPDCGTNEAIQDAEGCPGEDAGLTILNDGGGEINILNAVGFSMPATTASTVTLSATSLAFGSLSVGNTSGSQSVTLTNTGDSAVSITSIAVTGTGASQFVFANSCGSSLAAGANCSIHGHFAPTSAGAKTAAVTITDNASGSPQSISLSGTGVASAPAVHLSTTSLAFGSFAIGTSSGSQMVTMTNTGGSTLSISSIALTGTNSSSWVFANSCGSTLAAGASCTIHGHFAPLADGALTAAIHITDNASGSPQTISLTGTGTGAGHPVVSLSASKLSYGTVSVGSSSGSQSVTLTNTGSATLTITSISLTGADPGSWVFASTCGSTLAIGANCTIHGHFAPLTTGALSAAVTIVDNADGSPQNIALSGTGN